MPKNRESPLTLDQYRLDYEAARQSELYEEWATQLAAAKNRLTVAETELDLCEAELGLAIRTNPGKYGVKPTDKAVAAKILTLPEYREAVKEVNEAKYEKDQYEVMTKGLDHKKVMIENLCFLHGQSYFSKPRTAEPDRPKVRKRGRDA